MREVSWDSLPSVRIMSELSSLKSMENFKLKRTARKKHEIS